MNPSTRKRLPDTRPALTRRFELGEFETYVSVGFYDNHQPGEIFVTISKQGSTMQGLLNGWAVMVSMLLQSGWSWFRIGEKLRYSNFEPHDNDFSSIYDALVLHVNDLVELQTGNIKYDYDGKPDEEIKKGDDNDTSGQTN